MKYYDVFLFDLDGTLTDPKVGIGNSILYALNELGIIATEAEHLEDFIGPPLMESFKRYYGFSDEKARRAVGYYREYFSNKGIFENKIHVGVIDLLSKLDELGCHLVLATSKPTVFAERILEHFKVHQYFDLVVGSNMDLTRASKKEVIGEVLRVIPSAERSKVMIGDHVDDIMAAKEHMLDSVAVCYGYSSESELSEIEPTHIVRTVGDLRSLLLRFVKR
jgi:phosphoglycolate phosphatase